MNRIYSFFTHDLIEAFRNHDQWLFLGWHDIKSKYRRTSLGPLWIVIVNLITILCFSVVGAALFNQDVRWFLPHATVGLFVWYYVASILTESCMVFSSQDYLLQNLNITPLTLVLRMFVKNTISFSHSFIVIIAVILLFTPGFSIQSLLVFLAIPFFAITSTSISIILGIVSTRFRDINHAVQSLMTIFPFITPLIWKEEMLGSRAYIAKINPATHYIALFRDPLLSNEIKSYTYIITAIMSVSLLLLSIYIYNKFRHRLIYWL